MGIVVPARNEAVLLRRCLRSVLRAIDHSNAECFVVLVDDGSTDGTAEIARATLPAGLGSVLSVDRGNVGAARAAGVGHLLNARGATATWIACTDADTIVPEDWIAAQLAHATAGVDAVAGLVDVDCGLRRPLRHAFATEYEAHIGRSTHTHIHGANLGVSATSYLSVGGFAPLRCGEDRDLWARLADAGHRLVTDTRSIVVTSSRLVSRTNGGFASDLRRLSAGPPPVRGAIER